jgi:Leucine-rich repeat (LRR) protein
LLVEDDFDMILLDGIPIGNLQDQDRNYLEKFKNAKTLSLQSTHLKSVRNLPHLENLEKLDLSENQISGDGFDHLLGNYPGLKSLVLSNNSIRDFTFLEHLSCLNSL